MNPVTLSGGWIWQEAILESNEVQSLTSLLSKQMILLKSLHHSQLKKKRNGGGLLSFVIDKSMNLLIVGQ